MPTCRRPLNFVASGQQWSLLARAIASPGKHDIGLRLFVARTIRLRGKPETVLPAEPASGSVSLERPEAQAIKSHLRNGFSRDVSGGQVR
jgi:hypothetical protein